MNCELILRWSISATCVLVVVIGLAACNRGDGNTPLDVTVGGYESAKQDALMNIEVIRDFHECYPDAIEGFMYYTGTAGPTSWDAETTLYNRYQLVLRVPLELSSNRREVAAAGEPIFDLLEITYVEEEEGGVISMHHGKRWEFGLETWKELKKAQGRIEKVFEGIRTDAPVDGFDAYDEYLKAGDGPIDGS